MNTIFNNINEFYPTPITLLDKVFAGIKLNQICNVLEPSAGKGDIADYIVKHRDSYYSHSLSIDCIEKDETLQATLKGKGYRVVHDDFLTYSSYKKYDLIAMNPPFSQGAKHLLKAIDLMKSGGNIVCILNAETIKNTYSNERKLLLRRLEELNASIEFVEEAFSDTERSTLVEVAIIKIVLPEEVLDSTIYENLKKKVYAEDTASENTSLIDADYINAAVTTYNLEVECGIKLIKEYNALKPITACMLNSEGKAESILQLSCRKDSSGRYGTDEITINRYLEITRMKYWSALFTNEKFTGKMTSEQRRKYMERVEELKDYDFSIFNIIQIHKEMSANLISGIEECIIKLFDELSSQYSYYDLSNNIHYFNGWKTNKAWIIADKVIQPINAWGYFDRFEPSWHGCDTLVDIEKALNYLDGNLTDGADIRTVLKEAEKAGQTKNIKCKYFELTFYKKGTCHIKWTNKEILKKLNIFGAQNKHWLPQEYGRKTYSEMDEEARAVVDEFEGEKEYEKTLAKADYFIYNPVDSILKLETA